MRVGYYGLPETFPAPLPPARRFIYASSSMNNAKEIDDPDLVGIGAGIVRVKPIALLPKGV
jgi:hypothetical protein